MTFAAWAGQYDDDALETVPVLDVVVRQSLLDDLDDMRLREEPVLPALNVLLRERSCALQSFFRSQFLLRHWPPSACERLNPSGTSPLHRVAGPFPDLAHRLSDVADVKDHLGHTDLLFV